MPRRQAVASPKAIAPPQADALRSGANGFGEAYQHGDDRFVECHGFVEYRSVGFVPASNDIEPSDDFDRRASCDSIETRLLRSAELTGALSDIRDHGGRGAVELVAQTCSTGRQHGADAVAEFERVERAVIDVELLVVEGHGHFFVAEQSGLRIDFVPVL